MNRIMTAYHAHRGRKEAERAAMAEIAGEETGLAIFQRVEEKRRAQVRVS
jgi:hypothetical protein